ncbi:hypothetical protein LCGC14_1102820, partial [marine sediment metagenome]
KGQIVSRSLFLIALARGLSRTSPAALARLHDGLVDAAGARETVISLAQRVKVWPPGLIAADTLLQARITSLCTSHGLERPVFNSKPRRAVKVRIGQRWHYVPLA